MPGRDSTYVLSLLSYLAARDSPRRSMKSIALPELPTCPIRGNCRLSDVVFGESSVLPKLNSP